MALRQFAVACVPVRLVTSMSMLSGAQELPAPMSDERELLSELSHVTAESRLSCQIEFTAALAGLRIVIAPEE